MAGFTIHQAKTQLSRLIQRVRKGERIIIKNRNAPVAELRATTGGKKRLGRYEGQVRMSDDFDAPLADFESDS
ncbi:MAG: type II toxin-antitoxin system prevent-host-death family antitoxin [Deltaproteobacteria bacterium]|nr:type II toxin-antitoxin system prevent-host-death family antitoxin [Deltaproteobacteria bacterium]